MQLRVVTPGKEDSASLFAYMYEHKIMRSERQKAKGQKAANVVSSTCKGQTGYSTTNLLVQKAYCDHNPRGSQGLPRKLLFDFGP